MHTTYHFMSLSIRCDTKRQVVCAKPPEPSRVSLYFPRSPVLKGCRKRCLAHTTIDFVPYLEKTGTKTKDVCFWGDVHNDCRPSPFLILERDTVIGAGAIVEMSAAVERTGTGRSSLSGERHTISRVPPEKALPQFYARPQGPTVLTSNTAP